MGPRQDAGLDADRPDGVEVAAIHPLSALQHLLLHDPVLDVLEVAPRSRARARGIPRARCRAPDPRPSRPPSVALSAALMACAIACSAAFCARPWSSESIVGPLHLLGLGPALSISWRSSLIVSWMPFCATLSASRISASETSLSEPPSTMTIESAEPLTTRSMVENSSCWKVGLRIQFPRPGPRARRRGACPGTGERLSGRGRHHAEDVGVVLLVGGEDRHEDLHLVLETLGEERPDRAVDQAAGEDFLVGGRPSRLRNPPGILPAGRSSRDTRR